MSLFTSGWALARTKPFRLGSTKLLGRWGNNGQNQDKLFLTCMEARPGYLFVQCDQSGADALIVAYEAPAGKFRRLFELGIKPHTYMALQLFLDKFVPLDRARYDAVDPDVLSRYAEWPGLNKLIKESDLEYGLGKTTIHASNYDMKWPTFRDYVLVRSECKTILSAAQAKAFLQVHKKVFHEIVEWQNRVRAEVEMTRTLHNLFGHPRQFNGRMSEELIRDAYSWVPASTVAEITNNACCALQEEIDKGYQAHFINNKHDSFAAEVPEAAAIEAAKFMQSLIEVNLIASDGTKFRMRSEASIGKNLGKWDAKKNPDGMKEVKL